MPRIILLVGGLALAVAGTTTVAFRTTGGRDLGTASHGRPIG
jgi:hypothetical protein